MSAKVLTAAAAKEAKIELIENGAERRRARRRRRDARGAPFRFGEHEDESRRESLRRETVAAKRNWPRPRRLQVVADLAWRRRRLRTEAARLHEEDFQDDARLAFQKALSERIKAGDVLTVDKFAVKESKTKAFVALVKSRPTRGRFW